MLFHHFWNTLNNPVSCKKLSMGKLIQTETFAVARSLYLKTTEAFTWR